MSKVKSKPKPSFESYWASRTIKQRNELVRANFGLAHKIAFQVSLSCSVPFEDLRQVGFASLIQCVEKFDPSMGFKFSSFAVPIIRGRLLNYVRDKGHLIRIPRKYYDLLQQVKRVEKKLSSSLGRMPTSVELASHMDVSVDELLSAKRAVQVCHHTSTEDSLGYLKSNNVDSKNGDVKICLDKLNVQEKASIEMAFSLGLKKSKSASLLNVTEANLTCILREALLKVQVVNQS
jgi:RNA polymerase sigma-B factor